LGVNTTTYAYEVSPWQYFQKVIDCIVDFPDPVLELAVRNEMGVPSGDLMASDLSSLSRLVVYDPLSNLTGIEYATNLDILYIDIYDSTDILSLANLTNLTGLSLGSPLHNGTLVEGWAAPLLGLTRLEILQLDFRDVGDIDFLLAFPNLSVLSAIVSTIDNDDTAVLGQLTNLTSLSLQYSSINDFGFLPGLGNLLSLTLSGNQIDNTAILYISELSDQLTYLSLIDTTITDFGFLSSFDALTSLGLAANELDASDINMISQMAQLEGLGLDRVGVSDFGALSSLVNLRSLYLSNNGITNISFLSGLTNLHGIGLDNNLISDMEPLVLNAGLGEGDTVNLIGNPLNSVSCAVNIPALESRGVNVYHDCP
jgi:internalin A